MSTTSTPVRTRLAPIVVVIFLAGCGRSDSVADGPLCPVRGTVTAGGKPAPSGDVIFVPVDAPSDAPNSYGRIEADGVYTLRTGDRDGAPAGRYRVSVVLDDTKELKAAIDPRIVSTNLSPLVADIAPDRPAGAYDLKLDPQKSK
jgi:hypothetical protein